MTPQRADRALRRLERDTLIAGVVLALGALVLWPGHPGRAAGVLGGLALIAVSYQGIRSGVDAAWSRSPDGASAARPLGFVKFFTRHAILALGAYVMMARFEFDPMALLAGVTAPAIAATVELVRTMRARATGSYSRLS